MDFDLGLGIDPGLGISGLCVKRKGRDYSFPVDMGLFTIKTALKTILEIVDYQPYWQVLVAIELPGTGMVESRGHTFERCDVSRSLAERWADACAEFFGSNVLIQNIRPGERHLINCGDKSFSSPHEKDAYQILRCALGEKPKGPTDREKSAYRRLRESGRRKRRSRIRIESCEEKYRQPSFHSPVDWEE